MTDLSHYDLSPLRESDLILHRGASEGRTPVLVVAPKTGSASAEVLRRIEHEYALRAELDLAWAAPPIALTRHRDRMALVLADPGGEPLDQLCGRPWDILEFLRIAIPLAGALRKAHDRGLVHKDINPANILVDKARGGVWLTGFGIASLAPRERPDPDPPEVIAGTLAYMAPEQTGRMNRSMDSRSDLYALGVTLYELLTGALPFIASDPMELIHCHIAQQPVAPDARVAGIPAQLSAIVMKLLAKTAEERYQTAAGLEADLVRCLALYESKGRIDPFPLGARDVPDRLSIPEKLYGRDAEIETLLSAFDRVAALGQTGVVFISGESGVGKSSVVNELHKVLVAPRGLFASGKFDQYMRDIPYATVAQAFQGLVRQLLGKSEAELREWRQALNDALGASGQLIVNLVPELELVIGKQPPVADLAPQDAQTQFQMVFRRFLGVFAREDHPLALFLDDLQWLDTATLELIEHLATHPEVRSLLIVGAYRGNEVGPSHPLTSAIEAIRKANSDVREIVLDSLLIGQVGQLVADALHCGLPLARPLARLLHEKTRGNAFFVIQFLASLADEALLVFDSETMTWRWDIDRIRAKSYTENVVDLMAGKLGRLSDAARDALKQLACLGKSGDLPVLALVQGQTEDVTRTALREAVKAGLIVRRESAYAFLHDRIQQAAYSLIPEERRPEAHLRIGRMLLANLAGDDLGEQIFDVASQFNRGGDRLADRDERVRVATLHLRAGRKAKASCAYASAIVYLAAGMALLDEADWTGQHDLMFHLRLERAECDFLTGELDRAEQLFAELLQRDASKVELAAVYELKVLLHIVKSENQQAVDSALACLKLFDIDMPAHPSWEQVQAEYEKIWSNLNGRPIEALIDLPVMKDPELQAVTRLLCSLSNAAYVIDRNLYCLELCLTVNLGVRHGVNGAFAHACGFLGFGLGPIFRRYPEGFRLAKLGCDLVEKHGFFAYRAKVQDGMGIAAFWTHPLATSIGFIRESLHTAMGSGDLTYGCYGMYHIVILSLLRNDPLDAVWRESEVAVDFVHKSKFRDMEDIVVPQQRFVAAMQGRTATLSTLSGDQFDEVAFEARLSGGGMSTVACWYWITKVKACFLAGNYAEALAAANQAEALLWSSTAHFALFDYYFYAALALAALCEDGPADEQQGWRERLTAHQAQLNEWAESCPSTFADKHSLVSAEIARIEGRDADAMRLYEQAIQSARENGFVQNEGLAQEVAARFYASRSIDSIAQNYLHGARHCYLRWGAQGKVRQLEQLYPHVRDTPITPSLKAVASPPIERQDVDTIVRASQALSSEIRLPELIQKLIRIALEHAGAERGLLILLRDGELKTEAVAVTGPEGIEVAVREAGVAASDLPLSILHYVVRTRERVVLDDATAANLYSGDDYVRRKGARSVLCLPIVNQGNLVGALYLENNLTPHAFTSGRVALLEMLASQAAISLENARLYFDLQRENNDRKQVEDDLRRSEAHLHEAQRLGRMGSFVLDPFSGSMQASPELLRILGRDLDAEEPAIDFLREYIHPEDRHSIGEQRTKAIDDRVTWAYEFRIMLPDGSVRYAESTASPTLDTDGNLVEYVGNMIDVTDRKLAEQKLKMSETLLSEAQKLSHTGSYILDGPFGESIWTDEMFRVFEYDQSEPPSVERAIQRIHPDDRDRMRQFASATPDDRLRRDDGVQPPVEYRLVMPDGRIKVVVSLRAPAGPEFSGVGTIIGATMDITDRKRAEEALLRAQADLAHASRVNTMGELTAALAHEVNQPITAAVTNANACLRFLSGETPNLEEAREAVQAIVSAGTRAAQIVSRTREFFKTGVPQKALVDVDEVVRNTVVLLESEASRYSVSIRTWLAAGFPGIMGDHVQIQQVIMNLIMNGIDAMKEVEGVRELAIRSRSTDAGQVMVSISDTGMGLPPEGADQIFQTFFTTKADGTGMGLSISRSIVEAHGGRLWAEPNSPQGTTLQFTLPVAADSVG